VKAQLALKAVHKQPRVGFHLLSNIAMPDMLVVDALWPWLS
jgi:hypothetical protein